MGEGEDEGEVEDGKAEGYDFENPFGLDVVRSINDANQTLTGRLRELWRAAPEGEEIRLERRDLEAILAGVPEEGLVCRSASLFVNWVPSSKAGEESALVVGTSLIGYGKYFSRFLSVLPDELRRDLIDNNRHLTDQELAEICGDGAHNANLHPPLLPREISYPSGESGTAGEQIPSSQIVVGRDPRDPHRLRLQHARTGTGIVPVDLGFLNPRMRPPLFQLLSRFTPPATFQSVFPESPKAVDRPPAADLQDAEPQVRPRITYRGRLILARRQWWIPWRFFPSRGKKEREADYFLRIQRWREEMALPEDVFMRIIPLPSPPKPETQPVEAPSEAQQSEARPNSAEQAPRLRGHLYKPQYIDFRNPLLVDLFSRAAENLERAMFTFEERLPRGDQLLASGDKRCVTELVVQVDFPQDQNSSREQNRREDV